MKPLIISIALATLLIRVMDSQPFEATIVEIKKVEAKKPVPHRPMGGGDTTSRSFATSPAGGVDVARIWALESTQGTAPTGYHKMCEAKGMWNELGYGVYSRICFANKEEGFATVAKWFASQTTHNRVVKRPLTLSEALCYYSGHGIVSSCTYAQNYKTVEL